MSQSRRQCLGHGENNGKTYVWVKLRDDGSSCISPTQDENIYSCKNGYRRQRTSSSAAETANDEIDNLWKWTPGYYTFSPLLVLTSSESPSRDETVATASDMRLQEYNFTLLVQRSGRSIHEQLTVSENIASAHLENGDIVLANTWEIRDFMHRFDLVDSSYDSVDSRYYDNEDGIRDANYFMNNGDVMGNTPSQPPHDLIELTHLNEPSIVNALRYRYYQRSRELCHDIHNVYTYTGSILLAMNPFQINHDEENEKEADNDHIYKDEEAIKLLLYEANTIQRYKLDGEKRWIQQLMSAKLGEGNVDNGSTSSNTSLALPPHVYAVADRTFRDMLTRLHDLSSNSKNIVAKHRSQLVGKRPDGVDTENDKADQSILVSGESGAGKTVTTKLLMAYLSTLSTNGTSATTNSCIDLSIEKRILQSNPVLESFGNARTVRNDNSSRFGKYIEMKFSLSLPLSSTSTEFPRVSLVGASIETYLLEKVRLVHQSTGERNYHIFYELFSMKYTEDEHGHDVVREFEVLGLHEYDMEDFRMLSNSGTFDRRDGVSDKQTFLDTKRAMTIMGFTSSDISNVFRIIASLLHASNLTFVQKGSSANQCRDDQVVTDECALDDTNPHLGYAANLLGITSEKLSAAVCYHEITIGGDGGKSTDVGKRHNNRGNSETHQRVLTWEQAAKGIDALIKAIYGALFEYLVIGINSSISSNRRGGQAECSQVSGKDNLTKKSSIGILSNSFEQLCINYCNEALQQQFNRFVLKREQEEYNREGIQWSYVEFAENQEVLDLIDSKSGIFSIIHDQCRTPRATDKTLALCMYEKCLGYTRFEADSRQKAEQLFAVHHYAGLVEYDVEGFVQKNRDELPKNGLNMMLSSTNDFLRSLAEILMPSSATSSSSMSSKASKIGSTQRLTVGVQFSSQLRILRSKIDDASPHYIRCLKPNTLFAPYLFDEALISHQLRCAGVIEAVKVSRLGYPHRFSYRQFVARYHILGQKSTSCAKSNTVLSLIHTIKTSRTNNGELDVGLQVGKSKIFLRHSAHELLEKMRQEKIVFAALAVQKTARMYLCRKYKVDALYSVLLMQSFIRRFLAVIKVTVMRMRRNSIAIQSIWRSYSARKLFLSSKVITRWCHSHHRGIVDRKLVHRLMREEKAFRLQSLWRQYRALACFRRQRKAAILIQCAMRMRSARSKLAMKKADSRNMSLVIQERDRLREEAKILRIKLCKSNRVVHTVDITSGSEDVSLRSECSQEKKELQQSAKVILALESERDIEILHRKELMQINEKLKSEIRAMACEMIQLKNTRDADGNQGKVTSDMVGLDSEPAGNQPNAMSRTEILFLRNSLDQLAKEKEQSEKNLDRAAAEITVLKSERDAITRDCEDLKQVNKIIQSELNAREKELCHVMMSLEEAKKQNQSLMRNSKAVSTDSSQVKAAFFRIRTCADSNSDEGNTVSDWEDESRTSRLRESNVGSELNKRQAMYELDDMKRINRSLREDLEVLSSKNNALTEELAETCNELNDLKDDVVTFAEAFAAQEAELQRLQFENKKLLLTSRNH